MEETIKRFVNDRTYTMVIKTLFDILGESHNEEVWRVVGPKVKATFEKLSPEGKEELISHLSEDTIRIFELV